MLFLKKKPYVYIKKTLLIFRNNIYKNNESVFHLKEYIQTEENIFRIQKTHISNSKLEVFDFVAIISKAFQIKFIASLCLSKSDS